MIRRGLTFVELLLVMVIVSSLIAISLPTLVSVRNHAQSAVCMQNVRTLSLAWLMYKDYNNDRIVGGMAGDKCSDWVRLPADGSDDMTEAELDGIQRGALFPYTAGSLGSYHCPADPRSPDPTKVTHRSYSIVGGANGEIWKDPYTQQEAYTPIERYSQFTMPSLKYIFIEEADPTETNRGSWVLDPRDGSWVDPLSIRHSGDRSTFGFADGHVGTHRWVDASTIEMSRRQEFFFPVPATEGHDLRYMIDGFPQKPVPNEPASSTASSGSNAS